MQSIFYIGRNILLGLGQLRQSFKPRLLCACSGVPRSHPFNVGPAHFGDDAFFIVDSERRSVIGIADGVGGWRRYDVDPSKFTRGLMQNCERLARTTTSEILSPVGLLQRAYEQMMNMKTPLLGSCTACIVVMDKVKKEVSAANLGDSGFMIVRGEEVVYQSTEQQHYFNTPYQLSLSAGRQGVIQDKPSDAETTTLPIQQGDVIVMATDGLFDNVFQDQIVNRLQGINQDAPTYEELKSAADTLASDARTRSLDETYMSPFAVKALNYGLNVRGGKLDDITVLLASVMNDTSPPTPLPTP